MVLEADSPSAACVEGSPFEHLLENPVVVSIQPAGRGLLLTLELSVDYLEV